MQATNHQDKITKHDITVWKSQPVTQRYFKLLQEYRDDIAASLCNGQSLIDPNTALISTARTVGCLTALDKIIEQVLDESVDSEEEVVSDE